MTALILSVILTSSVSPDGHSGARLLRQPDISRDRIAFIHGLHSSRGHLRDPSRRRRERRLTWHPSNDRVAGFTPDGRKLLVHSDRLRGALTQFPRLFLLPLEGGTPEPLPMPRATHGSFSPDGGRIAYGPNPELVLWLPWKRYRGGSLGYVAIYDLERKRYEELPRVAANDVCPMWHDGSIYFASDRDRIMNLYRYDLASKRTERLTQYTEWDVKNPSLGPDAIVYENGGWLYSLDLSEPLHPADPGLAASGGVCRERKSARRGGRPWTTSGGPTATMPSVRRRVGTGPSRVTRSS